MSKVLLIGVKGKNVHHFKKIFSTVNVVCESVDTFDSAFEKIPGDPPALVITEKPDTNDSLHNLQSVLKTNSPATPFLVYLRRGTAASAMEALKAGAYDCLRSSSDRFHVLAAAKRATTLKGRSLFVNKVIKRRSPVWSYIGSALVCLALLQTMTVIRNGPPNKTISLGSANLSGIQWDGRNLWVGDWFDSTVTHYVLAKGILRKSRTLTTNEIYHMQDGQPIMICNTPDALITICADLKMRSHQWAVGLPTMQTVNAPGTNPTGLAWDGTNLWSIDRQSHLLYRHGVDLHVIDVVKSLVNDPVGMAFDGKSMWVLGASPLRLARLEFREKGAVWHGPYPLNNVLTEGILPSGMAVEFGRLWFVSGGDPRMTSKSIREIIKEGHAWTGLSDKEKNHAN